MWQKLIAAVCVMTGAFGFGMSLCGEMGRNIYCLKIQKQMLLYITGEISYLHRPLEEIFIMLSERIDEPYSGFLKNVAEKMNERSGKSIRNIWCIEIENLKNNGGLSDMCVSYLKKTVDCFECEGDIIQVEALELLNRELDNQIEYLIDKKNENGRLIKILSTLTGVLCVVLFL